MKIFRSLRKLEVRKPWRSLYTKLFKLLFLLIISAVFSSILVNLLIKLPANATQPVDAILVLGGSIRREIYAAKLSRAYPNVPILISQGSLDPCILLIFRRERIHLEQVWLEKCASSTFDNYFYAIPILRQWGVHKVKLITSLSHLPRAEILGKIMLNTNGIALDLEISPEQGVPGNNEFLAKTILDISRTVLWAGASQFIQPSCTNVTQLSDIDLKTWRRQKFKCERQGNIKIDFDNFPEL